MESGGDEFTFKLWLACQFGRSSPRLDFHRQMPVCWGDRVIASLTAKSNHTSWHPWFSSLVMVHCFVMLYLQKGMVLLVVFAASKCQGFCTWRPLCTFGLLYPEHFSNRYVLPAFKPPRQTDSHHSDVGSPWPQECRRSRWLGEPIPGFWKQQGAWGWWFKFLLAMSKFGHQAI